MLSRLLPLTLSALALLAPRPLAAAEKLERFRETQPHMGTLFQIILFAADEASAKAAMRDAFARVAALDASMSDYRPTSELMRLCAKAGGPPVKVSDDLFTVLDRAQQVSKLSDGAFDVTVGPVVRLWRVSRRTRKLPDPAKLAKARALVGYKNVVLDRKAHTVQLLKPGMQLDLGGIAKGYAADQTLAVLKKHGITRALVAAGGDIAVSGPPPDRPGWRVKIAPLEAGADKTDPHLLLHDAAVSTSGDAEQFVEIDGKRYSHVVDPRTGIGLVGRMSCTVVARNGLTADPLTKVACVLGPKRGLKLIEDTPGASGRVVRKTAEGKTETIASPRFPKLATDEHR